MQEQTNIVQILDQLEGFINYEKSAKPRDLSKLEAIKTLLHQLSNPHQELKIIHLAGTNGKGLAAAMISSVLEARGFKTGVYSSPHIHNVRERIKIHQELIPEESFLQNTQVVLQQASKVKEQGQHLSYFDLLTSIAFCAFKEHHVDWVILETGLGGRADSTNISPKELCVLTPIGYDHMEILGNTLELIAKEKLGICRPHIPLVLSEQKAELIPFLKDELQSSEIPFYYSPDCLLLETTSAGLKLKWAGADLPSTTYNVKRSQPFLECLRTALVACQQLFSRQKMPTLNNQEITAAVHTQLFGRLSIFSQVSLEHKLIEFPNIVVDGGHNVDALQALLQELSTQSISGYTLIFGIAADKCLITLKPLLTSLFKQASQMILMKNYNSRAASTDQILETFQAVPTSLPPIHYVTTAKEALDIAVQESSKPLVISGSFYLLEGFAPYFEFSSLQNTSCQTV